MDVNRENTPQRNPAVIYDELLSLPSSPSGGHALPMQRLSARETACLMLAAVPACWLVLRPSG